MKAISRSIVACVRLYSSGFRGFEKKCSDADPNCCKRMVYKPNLEIHENLFILYHRILFGNALRGVYKNCDVNILFVLYVIQSSMLLKEIRYEHFDEFANISAETPEKIKGDYLKIIKSINCCFDSQNGRCFDNQNNDKQYVELLERILKGTLTFEEKMSFISYCLYHDFTNAFYAKRR